MMIGSTEVDPKEVGMSEKDLTSLVEEINNIFDKDSDKYCYKAGWLRLVSPSPYDIEGYIKNHPGSGCGSINMKKQRCKASIRNDKAARARKYRKHKRK